MKKTILWGALVTLFSAQAQAYLSPQTNEPQTDNTLATLAYAAPATATIPTTATAPATPTSPPVINCDYKIPADSKQIEQSLITTWAQKAITQSFDMNHSVIDDQMKKLQACFTDQGWQGFNTALEKSGNIAAIKSQNLSVSSQIDGQIEVADAKENQWKINVPLQVVYQNDKEKVTQLLRIHVTIGRKANGDLGIMQMIATPRSDEAQKQSNAAASIANTQAQTANNNSDTNKPAI